VNEKLESAEKFDDMNEQLDEKIKAIINDMKL